ncbi:MAG: RHS repeat-associated core domain-containing protein, partial [Verrucomicrobiae bacterium]|nr:RHS repeat-associated core domain-containing protein [Verrucomicrobiae bacterium]
QPNGFEEAFNFFYTTVGGGPYYLGITGRSDTPEELNKTCSTCTANGMCTPTYAVKSVEMELPLGQSADGSSAGYLKLKSDQLARWVYTPAALVYGAGGKLRAEVKRVQGYEIRQVKSNPADAVNPVRAETFAYDRADQLVGAILKNTGSQAVLKEFSYRYDPAGNRISEQSGNGVAKSAFNSVNELTQRTAGAGNMVVRGDVSDASTNSLSTNAVSVIQGTNAVAATTTQVADGSHTNYTASAVMSVSEGTNTFKVVAKDVTGNVSTNNYQIVVQKAGESATLTYDPNGNLIKNVSATVTNSYSWDAKNQLVGIKKVSGSTTNESAFLYNGMGQRVGITEKVNGSVTSDKKLLWCGGAQPCEERDSTGATVTKQYFGQGMRIVSGGNAGVYFYNRDHLGSVREMTDSTGNLRARYDFDPYGRRTKLSGDLDSDFGFTGHYNHAASGLVLAMYRAYDSDTGRWLSRDPIGENGGINLYGYCENDPVNKIDPLGLINQWTEWWADLSVNGNMAQQASAWVFGPISGLIPDSGGSTLSGTAGFGTGATVGRNSQYFFGSDCPSTADFDIAGPVMGSPQLGTDLQGNLAWSVNPSSQSGPDSWSGWFAGYNLGIGPFSFSVSGGGGWLSFGAGFSLSGSIPQGFTASTSATYYQEDTDGPSGGRLGGCPCP